MRRRLEGVSEIAISQSRQTAEVAFARGPDAFSPSAFREAVGESGVEVLSFQVEACGVIEERDDLWLLAGKNRFLLTGAETAPLGRDVCVSGPLHDQSRPLRLEVADLQLLAD